MVKRYEILLLLNAMVAPPEKRLTIQQVKKKLPKTDNSDYYMQELISSMKHREKQTPAQAI